MGMHYGFVAVPAAKEDLVREFTAVWPQYEVKQQATLASLDAWYDWKRQNERFVSARDWTLDNPGVEVQGFLQDGDWAVLLDARHVLTADDEALARLSATFGRCLAFSIETTSGCASFAAYRDGQSERRIDGMDGEVRTEGEPLQEEEGLDVSSYYMDETEALQQRFGLKVFVSALPVSVLGVATVDRTDYSELLRKLAAAPKPQKKPWWKLW